MNEPKFCIDCKKPISGGEIRCHECHANYWLDDVYEGEGGSVPDYHDGDGWEYDEEFWEDEDD